MAKKISNIEELKKDYLAGDSLTKLQAKHGIERHALARNLRAAGVTIVQNNQKHSYNLNLFSNIDNELSAYWLGFLYADGSLGMKRPQIEVTLKSSDAKHIEKLRDLLCITLPIVHRSVRLGDKIYQAVRIGFSSAVIHAQLIRLGCTPKKSLTLAFPSEEQVPRNMHNHFIRGYFDGDGSVGAYAYESRGTQIHYSLEGTQNMLQGTQSVFLENITDYTPTSISKRSNQRSFVLQKGGNASVRCVYNYLYKDATVFLERKKDIFDAFYRRFAAQ